MPHMQRIAEEADITVCSGVWGNCGPTIVGWEAGFSSVLPSFPLGLVLPVTASATGKAFAAFLPEAVSRALVEAEFGASGPPNPSWTDAMQEVRDSRCALQDATRFWNEEVLIKAVSVPVRGSDGYAIVTMTAVVESGVSALVLHDACDRLKHAADLIERQLKTPPKA